jgi:hypothetical protein
LFAGSQEVYGAERCFHNAAGRAENDARPVENAHRLVKILFQRFCGWICSANHHAADFPRRQHEVDVGTVPVESMPGSSHSAFFGPYRA